MADNVVADPGSGGATFATDEDGGSVHHPYVKLEFGPADTFTKVSTSDPLPVDLRTDNLAGNLDVNIAASAATLTTNQLNLHTEDFDTGAGTDSTVAVGIAVPASGGAVVVPGDATAGLKVDLGADNDVVVSGSVSIAGTPNIQGAAGSGEAIATAGNPVLVGGSDGTLMRSLAVAADGAVHVDDGGNSITVDNGGTFAVQVDAALPAGTNAIGKLAANTGVDIGDVDVTSISAGANLIGDVGLSGARTSGGTTLYRNVDVDETEDEIKGTAGQLYWLHAMNLTAAVLYLQLYNDTAANVIVGTTTPDLTFPLPTPGDTNGAGFTLAIPNGIAFSTAITIACTTTVGGAAGPAANGCIVNLGFA